MQAESTLRYNMDSEDDCGSIVGDILEVMEMTQGGGKDARKALDNDEDSTTAEYQKNRAIADDMERLHQIISEINEDLKSVRKEKK